MRNFMNKQEEFKANIIKSCVEGKMTVKAAAMRLKLSERHVKSLKKKYREEGACSILHGNCGRQPKHTISVETRQEHLIMAGGFSLNNVIFKVNNCYLNPKTKVTVLISKKIGVTVQMIIAQFVFANCFKSERIA